MSLVKSKVLILDCQTTGMHPSIGDLLEIAWYWGTPDSFDERKVESYLFKQDESLSPRVTEITGISDQDLERALPPEEIYQKLARILEEAGDQGVALIHYARFEKPFLDEFFSRFDERKEFPIHCLCSHQIAARLYPGAPSRNIRGLVAYLSGEVGEVRRASEHVRATALIWQKMIPELGPIQSFVELDHWIRTQKARRGAFEYRVERKKRLSLPDKPGVYKFLAQTGEVLYVGKASSLRSRVNSYFRGRKGRDSKKLEMMARAWDVEVYECGSSLEAAVFESDEIKKYDPPYNISLKPRHRTLVFYSRDFSSTSTAQDAEHPIGPFRSVNAVERLRELIQAVDLNRFNDLFFKEFTEEELKAGFSLFCERLEIEPYQLSDMRLAMTLALRFYRRTSKQVSVEIEEEEIDPEGLADPESIASKFERILLRAAARHLRVKMLSKLLDSRVSWKTGGQWRSLEVRRGRVGLVESSQHFRPEFPWSGLNSADYDRISVLYSELIRHPHEIENLVSRGEASCKEEARERKDSGVYSRPVEVLKLSEIVGGDQGTSDEGSDTQRGLLK